MINEYKLSPPAELVRDITYISIPELAVLCNIDVLSILVNDVRFNTPYWYVSLNVAIRLVKCKAFLSGYIYEARRYGNLETLGELLLPIPGYDDITPVNMLRTFYDETVMRFGVEKGKLTSEVIVKTFIEEYDNIVGI